MGIDLGQVVDRMVRSVSHRTWKGFVAAWGKWRSLCFLHNSDFFSGDPALPIAFICFC